MAPMTLAPADPVSSGEIQLIDPARADDVDRRHAIVAEMLDATNCEAVVIRDPANFAWFTAGGDNTRRGSTECSAALFVTPEARVAISSNIDSGQLFDRELAGLGFQLKERPWHEPREKLIADLCRGRSVGSDRPLYDASDLSSELAAQRLPLSERETDDLRDLAREVTHAVEATARTFKPGQTEAEVAGQVLHRLTKHEIVPVCVQVMADGQGHRYRHWSYGADRIERVCVISAIGRRGGLHASTTRTASIGPLVKSIEQTHHIASLVQATAMFFSQRGQKINDIWPRIERIYEKFGAYGEWHLAEQGAVMGYSPVEQLVTPGNAFQLNAGCPVLWKSSVHSALAGDTILVRESGFELLTRCENWPELTIEVKGKPIHRPAILIREEENEWAL